MSKARKKRGGHSRQEQVQRPRTYRLWHKLVLGLVVGLITYVVAEGVFTYAYTRGVVDPHIIWILEQTGEEGHIEYDFVRGFRLSSSPARLACIGTNGTVYSTGVLRGNNEGFPDRDDFYPDRGDRQKSRFAVFGDSFTAAPYIDLNWPDRAENLAAEKDQQVQLLNLSVFGEDWAIGGASLLDLWHERNTNSTESSSWFALMIWTDHSTCATTLPTKNSPRFGPAWPAGFPETSIRPRSTMWTCALCGTRGLPSQSSLIVI